MNFDGSYVKENTEETDEKTNNLDTSCSASRISNFHKKSESNTTNYEKNKEINEEKIEVQTPEKNEQKTPEKIEVKTPENTQNNAIIHKGNPENEDIIKKLINTLQKPEINIKNSENQSKAQINDIIPVKTVENKPIQPKIIDKGRQRKEEFERKMKEKSTNENKLQALKQKFQTDPLKETKIEEIQKKMPLTPKENNIPEEKKEEKTIDFDALQKNLQKKLDDLQKEEKNVISLKDYRNKLKKNNAEKPENKFFINERGQKINKSISGIISSLENKLNFGAKENMGIERNSMGNYMGKTQEFEHITMERTTLGHKRIKSKNTDFFDSI